MTIETARARIEEINREVWYMEMADRMTRAEQRKYEALCAERNNLRYTIRELEKNN